MLKENRGDGKHTAKRVMGINIETGEQKIWESFTAAALEVAGKKQANANIHETKDPGDYQLSKSVLQEPKPWLKREDLKILKIKKSF